MVGMVVSFTPNLGLAKPDESELALNWARSTQLADDNNVIIAAAADFPIISYTPTLIATTVNPSFGAGNINGQYQNLRGIIMGTFTIHFTDPGVAAGTGEYAVSLPLLADSTYHAVGGTTIPTALPGSISCIGEGYVRDNTSVNNTGTVALDLITLAGVSYVRLVTETYVGKTNRLFNNTLPFVVATGDNFTGSFVYKKA